MDASGYGRLSWDDAQILDLESSAIKGHTCKLVLLEPGPNGEPIELEALQAHVEARLGRAPVARRRVAKTPLGLAPPVWVDDERFDIAEQVRGHDAGRPLDGPGVLEVVSELMAERLDHTRPLWRMDLVGPLAEGGSAIVVRIHHCMADGITCLRLGAELLWDSEPDPAGAAEPEPPEWIPAPAPDTATLLLDGIRYRVEGAARALAGAGQAAVSPGRWREAAGELARLPGALARELAPGESDPELDHRLGSRRAVAFVARELDHLKAIAHRASESLERHVTINDVVLAAVSGALHGWLGDRGDERLRAQIPVSMHTRSESEDELGNRDSFLFVDLPLSEPDPLRRLAAISAETIERKQLHDADELYAFFHALGRLGPLGRAGVRVASGPREFSLSVSNVPGPREPIYVLGKRVRALHSLAEPADRHALRISIVSCGGGMSFGLCADPDAVEDLEGLAAELEAALDRLADHAEAASSKS